MSLFPKKWSIPLKD